MIEEDKRSILVGAGKLVPEGATITMIEVRHIACDATGHCKCPTCGKDCWHKADKWGGCSHAIAAGTMDGRASVVIRCE